MNILIAGIPVAGLVSLILERDPKARLWVAESRPFEAEVSREISNLQAKGISVTVLTDNMLSALLDHTYIDTIWSLYIRKIGEQVEAINGALTAALLAEVHRVPFGLYPIAGLPEMVTARFGNVTIGVDGAKYIDHAFDMVPLNLAAEVIEHGD